MQDAITEKLELLTQLHELTMINFDIDRDDAKRALRLLMPSLRALKWVNVDGTVYDRSSILSCLV